MKTGATGGSAMLEERFLGAIDWFIPPQARTDAAMLGRARIFVFSHLFGPALGQAISIYLYFADPTHGFPFWVIVISITLFWALPVGMKLIGRLQPLAWFSVENLTFVTLFGSYYYGGVSSPFLPWLLIALLLGFFYIGERPFMVLGIFCANVAGFFAAYLVKGSFPQHIPLEGLSGVGIVSVTTATIYMAMMALYYADVVASQSGRQLEAARHRATAERLRKAMEEAEWSNRQKSVFLAKMSHQLRTPLNAVIGYSEILLEDAKENEDEQIADLQRINSAGKHLLSLVTDVLDMSKIESNKTDLTIQPFHLNDFIDDVVSTGRSLVTTNGNEFIVDREPGLGIVISDETRLRQAVLNLLSNAGKFTKDGRVTLSASRQTEHGEDWIGISVSDTGIGITQDNLRKLFKDFNQADASTASKYGGTGLGLALSRHLCRMMGGNIDVQSDFGRGSRFTIRIPAYLEQHRGGAVASGSAAVAEHDTGQSYAA
ncbi:MAG TPA: ATP-binding protein [Micropepsaceae bacterium]|nr:ATP-binding protein [Micropepsaceae bacterium]